MRSEQSSHLDAYRNRILTLIAGMLGVLVVQDLVGLPDDPAAKAAQRGGRAAAAADVPFNPAQQRKEIRIAVEKVDDRLKKIEQMLSKGLDVRVQEMPPVQVME